jgi:hypothetical protein
MLSKLPTDVTNLIYQNLDKKSQAVLSNMSRDLKHDYDFSVYKKLLHDFDKHNDFESYEGPYVLKLNIEDFNNELENFFEPIEFITNGSSMINKPIISNFLKFELNAFNHTLDINNEAEKIQRQISDKQNANIIVIPPPPENIDDLNTVIYLAGEFDYLLKFNEIIKEGIFKSVKVERNLKIHISYLPVEIKALPLPYYNTFTKKTFA